MAAELESLPVSEAEQKAVETEQNILKQKEDYLAKAKEKREKSENKAKAKYDELAAKAKAQYDQMLAKNEEAYQAQKDAINKNANSQLEKLKK